MNSYRSREFLERKFTETGFPEIHLEIVFNFKLNLKNVQCFFLSMYKDKQRIYHNDYYLKNEGCWNLKMVMREIFISAVICLYSS